jgi:hypothetical protein
VKEKDIVDLLTSAMTKKMTRKQKAEALVEWGVVSCLEEAYMYLEDMGEK